MIEKLRISIKDLLQKYNLWQFISEEFSEGDYGSIYLVGGAIRDFLFITIKNEDHNIYDIDIAVEKNARLFARSLGRRIDAFAVYEMDRNSQTSRIIVNELYENDIQIDITLIREGNIFDDLIKRDFTINSFAFRLFPQTEECPLISHKKGLEDVFNNVIRMSSSDSFSNDPVRIIRAIRLKGKSNFTIEPNTLQKMLQTLAVIWDSPFERITEEMFKLFRLKDYSYLEIFNKIPFPFIPNQENFFLNTERIKSKLFDFENLISTNEVRKIIDEYLKIVFLRCFTKREMIIFLLVFCDFVNICKSGFSERKQLINYISNYFVERSSLKSVYYVLSFYSEIKLLVDNFNDSTACYLFYEVAKDDVAGALIMLWINHPELRGKIKNILVSLNDKDRFCPVLLVNGNDIMNIFSLRSSNKIGELIKSQKIYLSLNPLASKENVVEYLRQFV